MGEGWKKMEMDGGKESNSRGNNTKRGREEEKSGLMVLFFFSSFFGVRDTAAVATSHPRVCADGSQGPLLPKLVSANWAC